MSGQHRIRHIDGLRGVAVLSVAVFHTWAVYPAIRHNHWLAILNSGRHGVDLFFVLSGFCLSYPTLHALHARGQASFDLTKYGASRLVRIIPPYYAAIALCCIVVAIGLTGTGHAFGAADVLRQALFVDRDAPMVNPSFWTLAIEFRWYFLFPVALALWTRNPYGFAAALLAIPLLWTTRAASVDLLLLPGFLLGIVAADIAIRGSRFARYCPLAFVCLGIIATVIDPTPRDAGLLNVEGFNPLWMPVSFLLVVSVGKFAILRRLFASRWLTIVGLASYSIYLVHQPFIDALQHAGVAPAFAISIAIAAGFAFWAVIERPFVETPLRGRAIGAVQRRLTYCAQRLRVPNTTFVMRGEPAKTSDLEAIA